MKSHRELSKEVELILAKSSWIIDGMHTGWCDPLIFEADMVVWCHIKDEIRGDNRHPTGDDSRTRCRQSAIGIRGN